MKRATACAGILVSLLMVLSLLHGEEDEGEHHAKIIARVSLTGQTGAVPATTLFTPREDGLFRVSAYLVVTGTNNAQQGACFDLRWTDDSLTLSPSLGFSFPPTPVGPGNCGKIGARAQATIVIRAKAHTPVSFLTNLFGPAFPYDFFITAEKL